MAWTESTTSSESLCLFWEFNFQSILYPSYTGSPACWLAEGTCRGVFEKCTKQHNSQLLQHLSLPPSLAGCCDTWTALGLSAALTNTHWFEAIPNCFASICLQGWPLVQKRTHKSSLNFQALSVWNFFLDCQLTFQTSLKTELRFTPRLNRSVCSSSLKSYTRNNNHLYNKISMTPQDTTNPTQQMHWGILEWNIAAICSNDINIVWVCKCEWWWHPKDLEMGAPSEGCLQIGFGADCVSWGTVFGLGFIFRLFFFVLVVSYVCTNSRRKDGTLESVHCFHSDIGWMGSSKFQEQRSTKGADFRAESFSL